MVALNREPIGSLARSIRANNCSFVEPLPYRVGADFRCGFNLRNTQHEQMSSRSSPKSRRWSGTPQNVTWIDRLWNVSRVIVRLSILSETKDVTQNI